MHWTYDGNNRNTLPLYIQWETEILDELIKLKYNYTTVEPLNADTPQIWTLGFVPILAILYKTTHELRTPLKSEQLLGPQLCL